MPFYGGLFNISLLYTSFFYERLANPMQSLDESVQNSDFAAISAALQHLLEVQYRHYQNQLQIQERKNNDHLTFMNQWIHQMKTPLSVIELITQDEVDPRFESINEETDRLKKGLEMALYVARLEAFTQDFYVEKYSYIK